MTRAGRSSGAASQRQLRVGEELRHALAEVFARDTIREPALDGVSVTISEVRMSPDLRNARAYVLPLGGGDTTTVLEGLRRCVPYLRGQVAKRVRMKYMPKLEFEIDSSFETASHIDTLLRGLDGDDREPGDGD
jgi:ribosome-binding factor A